ncbi:site-specific integrase [Streptomyces fuscichromogenes]|uniref:Core-binding (CB) domain-containing protein n=1 Tax=Streptomyces fuscichromogenes TaxID=1324013 RepID=A0A917XK82_9ACTN|nr:hypothetical protein [Streptomyces fuscichromogenes]GGN34055.1 hypothetical protein GCM10011578_074500 [Streptomyces fuscichromogenes]
MNSPGSCGLCATWGTITGSGLCYECRCGRYPRAQGGLREAVCRRCGWAGIVGADGTCRGCRIAVRLGQDPAWMHAEFERRDLPAGRPLQLAVRIEGLALNSNPLRNSAVTGPRHGLAPWARGRVPAALDDPAVCVEEVPGQLGLFAPWPRTFTRAHGKRIRGRTIPDFLAVQAVLDEMAAERRVGQTWHFHTEEGARLALAARTPDGRLVRPETLADLPQMAPTLHEALKRAGLLAPPRLRLVPSWMSASLGSCRECLAWTNERDQRCAPCLDWGAGRQAAPCHRCGRLLPLRDDHCRRCVLTVAETDYDLDGIRLDGGDQLWFGGPLAPRSKRGGLYGRRRLQRKCREAIRASRAARPVSEHLVQPGQLELFHLPRDWTRLDQRHLPALTPAARILLNEFVAHIKSRGWDAGRMSGSIRTLRVLLAHLGADAPLPEEDVRLIARRTHFHGARVINYLLLTGRLAPDRRSDAALARARHFADAAPVPFRGPLNRWIDVLCGTASRPSRPLAPSTVYSYLRLAAPALQTWYEDGVTDLRAVTRAHIEQTLEPVQGEAVKSLATALRSLFRALKRERLIFRDPARAVSLTAVVVLPRPLADDMLRGALDRLPRVRDRLSFVLAAVHALSTHDQRHLLLDDLDHSRATLLVRRTGKPVHIVYLDELTYRLARQWLAERYRRWPATTNPYLLVTTRTATDDTQPPVSIQAINKPLRAHDHQTGRLRVDRILNEAQHTDDPLHIIRLFGLSPRTAMKYIHAAHPHRSQPDPITP